MSLQDRFYQALKNRDGYESGSATPAPGTATGNDTGSTLHDRFLAALKSRDGYEPEQTGTQTNNEKVTAPSGAVTGSGSYYKRPEFGTQADSLYSAAKALEPEYQQKQTALKSAEDSLKAAQGAVNACGRHLALLEENYKKSPSQLGAAAYNEIYKKYESLQAAYQSAYGTYTAAYEAYKPAEEAYISAAKIYEDYIADQQAQFSAWRSTIRDAGTVQAQIDEVQAELNSLRTGQTLDKLGNIAANVMAGSSGFAVAQSDDTQRRQKIAELEAQLALLQEEWDWSEHYRYNALRDSGDFAAGSRYRTTANGNEHYDPLRGEYTDTGFGDILYDYINRNEQARDRYFTNTFSQFGGLQPLVDQSFVEEMSDDEIGIYNYLYSTKGRAAAQEYLLYLQKSLTARQRESREEELAIQAKEDPVSASIVSTLIAPAKGLGYIGQTLSLLGGKGIDENAAYNSASHISGTLRNEVSQQVEEKWGKPGSFLYQTGMSMADFLINTGITGGNSTLSMIVMGTGAAADTVIEAKDRGLNDAQAFTLGTVAGLAEAITEKYSIETLLDSKLLKDGTLKYILKNALTEGTEEVSSSAINLVADLLVSQDQSQWRQSMDAYIADGKTEQEAFGLAVKDQLLSMGADFLGGMLSGGVLSGGNAVIQNRGKNFLKKKYGLKNVTENEAQDIINSGLESKEGTDSHRMATELQKKLDAGKMPTADELARLLEATDLDIQEEAEDEDLEDSPEETAESQAVGNSAQEQIERNWRGDDTQQAPFVTQKGQIDTLTPENGTVSSGNVPLSVAEQIRTQESMNGGNINAEQWEGTERVGAAQFTAGAEETGTGVLHGGSQWYDGTGTREQAGKLAGGAGQAAQRGAVINQRRAAVDRQNRIRSLRLPKVSSKELGLPSGTDVRNLQTVPQEHWDTEMQQLTQRVYQETGKNVTYVMGAIQIRGADGKAHNVNGVMYGDSIIVRADSLRLTMEQIADHEAYHGRVDVFGGRLNQEIRRHIVENFSEEEFRSVVTKYVEGLMGVYDMTEVRTGAEYEAMMRKIEEEVFADAYAGINAFGAGADMFTSVVNQRMEQLHTGRYRSQENGVRETNGPPEERFLVNADFASEVEAWMRDGMAPDQQFILGSTGDVLQGLGAIESDIYMQADKILKILKDHPEMNLEIIKKIPEIVDNPVLVLKSKNVKKIPRNTRLVMFGSVKAENGQPVLCVLDLRPVENRLVIDDMQKVTSAYTKDDAISFIRSSDALYADKKRTAKLLRTIGLHGPIELQHSGYIGSISYIGQNVNIDGVPFTEIIREIEPGTDEISDEEFQKRRDLKLPTLDNVENDVDSQMFGDSTEGKKPRESFSVDDTDQAYMVAVEQGDLETAQRMVEETAKAAGYDSPMLYHGTQSFGFTEFDLSKMDDKRTIFLTDNERIAASYSGVMGKRDASGRRSKAVEQLTLQELVEELNSEQYGVVADEDDQFRYSYLSLKDINLLFASVNDRVEGLQAEVSQIIREYANRMAMDFDEKDVKAHSNLVKLNDQLNRYQYDKISTTLYMLLHHTDVFNDSAETAERIANLERDIRLMNKLQYRDNSDGVIVESWLNGYSLTALDDQTARAKLEIKRKTGNYSLYAKLENPLVIDAEGSAWNDIRHWYKHIDINFDNTRVERRGEEYLLFNNMTGEEITEGRFGVNAYTSSMPEMQRHSYMVNKAQSALSIITENMNTTREIAAFAQKRGYDGVIFHNLRDNGGRNAFIEVDELADIYTLFNPSHVKSADPVTYDANGNVIPLSKRFNDTKTDVRYSIDDEGFERQEQEKKPAVKKSARPVAESLPIIAKKDLRNTMMNLFSIPDGSRAELGTMIDHYADRLLKNGTLTEQDRKHFFDRMYESGVMTVPADDYFAMGRSQIKGGRIYIPEKIKLEFGDDWNDIRRRAFGAGVYLTSNRGATGIDQWNQELAELLPGLFDSEETDMRSILERIVQVAEEGKDERLSLAEYTAKLAEMEHQSEEEFLDNMERQMDWALRTFAEKAKLEIHLRDRTGKKIAQEREEYSKATERKRVKDAQRRAEERQDRKEAAQRARDRKELSELQKKTLKQLQWLNKNRNRAPEELKATWDEVLGDIDLYAVSAANEMRWSKKYDATWKDLAQMYKDAMKNDPNFLPSKDLEKIVARLDGTKIEDMDIGALQDLYKAAIGLRTEFYNRNNVINDEMQRLFAEVYTDAKREIEAAPGGFTGKVMDKFLNLDQLTPMNVLQRMGGWDPNGAFYSMAKQLEKGERDIRAYKVKAQKMLQEFLTEHEDWVKKADGQGKDAIWYEIEVPQLLELRMGDKPIFGPTVKVYMTPAQKVHMYLESKNVDNLRHMTGGRTFANKELYSQGKRQEALSQGRTIRLAPETVKALVSDLTAEEMELARLLDQYYNSFATKEINKISNILYGYDKAMGKNYAPIYTNRNYTKAEFGVFDVTAEGVGNLKGRQYAVNPSYNISALDAFERHVDQTARFCGMAIPARNWTTLMNWREKNNSTGDVITHKWGEESKRYISDLITKLQGGEDVKTDTISAGLNKLQSNYISAIFGANPSIVLKQLGSIPLAGAYLDMKNAPTASQIRSIDRELISKYSQDLEWRTMGYTTPETKQLKENPNWTQTNKTFKFLFGGGAITAMDGWAASVLWPWAENKVRREHPELELGSKAEIDSGNSAFYKKVAEEFENAMSRSQSVSDEIHQGSLRKSKNPITRAFTMFRSDSAQTYNALRQKIGEAQYFMKTGAKDDVIRAAKNAAGAAFVALLLNAVWSECINFLMALWKNKGKHYRDDEDELTAGSVAGEMVSGVLGSFAGVTTGGEELYELIGNIVTGDTWYGIETPGMEQMNDMIDVLVETGTGMRDIVAGGWDIVQNGGDLGAYFSEHSGQINGSIKDLASAAAMYLPGLPLSNVEAYLLGGLKWISPELGAAYDDLLQDEGKNDLAGTEGEVLASRLGRILAKRQISESENTTLALSKLYEAGFKTAVPSDTPSSVSINGEQRKLGVYQQQAYDTIWSGTVAGAMDDIVESDAFEQADETTRAKMLRRLYDYASAVAKAELFDDYEMESATEKNIDIVASGASVAECMIWNTVTADMKSGEKAAELASWDLPEEAKREIFYNKISDSREDSIEAVLNKGLSFDQFLQAYSTYSNINASDMSAGMKATEFAHWTNAQSFTEAQAAVLKDELSYFNMTPAQAGRYDELVDSGLDTDDAYDLTEQLDDLDPAEGEDKVTDLQRWRVCVEFSDDVEDQLTALYCVMSESQYGKVELANSFGVEPAAYLDFYEARARFDEDQNGTFTQAEYTKAVSALDIDLRRKAALWQIVTGARNAKNNPFSVSVGEQVLTAKDSSKNNTGTDVESETLSDAIMKQLLGQG